MTDKDLAQMYLNVKRAPSDSGIYQAIKVHAQACGLIAFVANVHPDDVALAVKREIK